MTGLQRQIWMLQLARNPPGKRDVHVQAKEPHHLQLGGGGLVAQEGAGIGDPMQDASHHAHGHYRGAGAILHDGRCLARRDPGALEHVQGWHVSIRGGEIGENGYLGGP